MKHGLWNIWFSYIIVSTIWQLKCSTGKESCPNRGAIRLQNGANKFEGRVEVCGFRSYTNQTLMWKTVCNAGWDINEATVVCRQLGFSGDLDPIPVANGTFSDHRSRHIDYIIKINFTCRGDESALLNCTYNNRNSSYCHESQLKPAGVYCFGHEQRHCKNGEIRLSDSTNNASGRVEVCLDGVWGTVCDDGWDSNDATTVCRQLGYSHKRAIPTRAAYFGEGSGPIHLSRAQCSSRDTRLIDCKIDKTGINECNHSEDAGVVCMGLSSCGDGDVQLVGGESEREERVEICYNGVWGTVCADSSWNEVNANAVCQQLGITYQRALPINDSHFGAGDGPILLENLWCSEEHSNLSQCVDFMYIGGRHHCEHTAGVICMDEVMMSTSTEEVPTATVYVTTANMSCDSTYKSHDTTSTASDSSAVAIIGAVGALIIMIAIAVITMVLIARLRLKANSHIQVNENIAYGEVSHYTSNAPKDESSNIRMEENVAYGQVATMQKY